MIEAKFSSPVETNPPLAREGVEKFPGCLRKACCGIQSFFMLLVILGSLLPCVVSAQITLADALECPEIGFSTTAPTLVYGAANLNPADGDDGVVIGPSGVLAAAFTGPAVLSWSGDSLSRNNLNCYLDGFRVNADGRSLYVPPGSHEVRWVSKAGVTSRLYSVVCGRSTATTPGAVMNGGELNWSFSPNMTAASHDGGVVGLLLSLPAGEPGFYGMRVPVQGPGALTLRLSIPGYSAPVFRLNGVVRSLGLVVGNITWQAIEIPIPAGPQVLEISAPAGAAGQSAGAVYFLAQAATWKAQGIVSLAEALDAPELVFITGGSTTWGGVEEAGKDKARVSQVPPGSSAWMETQVMGPGLLSYRSSPGMAFAMDGAAEQGTPYWLDLSKVQFHEIPAGSHTIRWTLSVDRSAEAYAGLSAEMDDVKWHSYQAHPLSAWTAGQGFSLKVSDHQWSRVAGPDLDGGGSLHPLSSATGPAWVEGVFSGPAMLVFSTYRQGGGVVTVNGTARTLSLNAGGGTEEWSLCHVAIPAGSHTVRWTGSANNPFFYLDGLWLLPATGSLSDAAELPTGGSLTGNGKRAWLPVSDSSLPDGDALMCEGGFQQSWPDDDVLLSVPITGPVRVTFRTKGNSLPGLAVDGFSETTLYPAFTTVWTGEPDGWRKGTLDLLPGPHMLSIRPVGSQPLSLDGMEITQPMRIWQPGEAVIVPGAVFTTNPANPLLGISQPDGSSPALLYGSSQPGGPDAWLEMRVTGPGVARFQFRMHYSFTGLPLPATLQLSVNGTVLPAPEYQENSGTGVTALRDLRLSTPNACAVCLPEGDHTLRWTIHSKVGEDPGTYELSGFSFSSGPALWTPPPGAGGAFLCSEREPLQISQEGGQTILRLGSGPPSIHSNSYNPNGLMTWASPGPGLLKFWWRRIPGAMPWPTGSGATFTRSRKFQPASGWASVSGDDWKSIRGLGGLPEWQAAEMTVPFGATHGTWSLPRTIPGIELAGFSFTPWEAIPLNEAAGIEGAVFSTDPASPWRGFRDGSGGKFLIPPYLAGNGSAASAGWLSASINRPGVLGWHRLATSSNWDPRGRVLLDGQICVPPFVVPNGPHTVTWSGPDWSLSATERVHNISFQPLSAAYAGWQVGWDGLPFPVQMLLPDLDFDQDGQVNAMEFAFRTDPLIPSPPPALTLHREGGSIEISLPAFRPLADGVQLVFETSPDMVSWSETASEVMLSSSPGQARYRLLQAGSPERLFVRAAVKLVAQAP